MQKKFSLSFLLIAVFLLSACATPPAPTASPTAELPTLPPVVTSTQVQLPTVASPTESAPTPTLQPSGNLPDISSTNYLDDRSTPAALMLSYFNAINRQEYLRAYSYVSEVPNVGPFEQFPQGYADTRSVTVTFGSITAGGAAGSTYYTVPMILKSVLNNGAEQKFANCYILQLPQPANYGNPPINPMHVLKRTGKLVTAATSDAAALASACPSPEYAPGPNPVPTAIENQDDLSNANYIDNRTDPVMVIKSYLNAINSQQYVRAYSYFQDTNITYSAFAGQFANTQSVNAVFGTATPDAGAGQTYYSLPVVLKSIQKDGSQQTFSICYTLHISQPAIQATPPFQPLGIKTINYKAAAAGADTATLLASACQ